MAAPTATGKAAACGFTYLSLLFFLAVLGVGLAATAVSWQTSRQSEKEQELLNIGNEIRDAIGLYYNRSPSAVKEYPRQLNDLLKDPRHPGTQRYLRRIYRDPVTGRAEWGIVAAPGGGIMGVHSLSKEAPLRRGGFGEGQKTYADWKFFYEPPMPMQLIKSNPLDPTIQK
jgi:type II secretory pathway pseudopilin PulG